MSGHEAVNLKLRVNEIFLSSKLRCVAVEMSDSLLVGLNFSL